MTRLTITPSEGRHLALREAGSKRRKAIGQLIEESLEFDGIKTTRSGTQLVANARARIPQRSRCFVPGGGQNTRYAAPMKYRAAILWSRANRVAFW